MTEDGNGSQNETINAQFGEQTDNGNIEDALVEQEVEAAKEEVAEKPEENDEFNRKFAALSRKEKEFRQEREAFELERSEIQKLREEMEAAKPQVKEQMPLEYRLKRDPMGTLAELGYDYEALTNLALNDGKLPNDTKMQLMREEIERELEDKYKSLEERISTKEKQEEENKYNDIINNFKNEIDQVVKSDGDAYELIGANDANDLVYEVIEEHHKETGNVLEIKEAAEAVEAYLYEEAQKYLKLKKLSRGMEPQGEQKPNEERQSPTTLSNDHSAQSVNDADHELTAEESLAKAASMLKWD